jgi:hypothetical protein
VLKENHSLLDASNVGKKGSNSLILKEISEDNNNFIVPITVCIPHQVQAWIFNTCEPPQAKSLKQLYKKLDNCALNEISKIVIELKAIIETIFE